MSPRSSPVRPIRFREAGTSSATTNSFVRLVVDAALRRPRQHDYFGLSNERGLSTVASGRDKLFGTLAPERAHTVQPGRDRRLGAPLGDH